MRTYGSRATAMVGPEGSGFKLALNALNLSRAFVATLAVGIMQRALDESVKYAKERKQFRPLSSSSRWSSRCWRTWRSRWKLPDVW